MITFFPAWPSTLSRGIDNRQLKHPRMLHFRQHKQTAFPSGNERRRARLQYCPIAHLHQLLHRDRQVAHPLAGGMEHGIGDGSSSADYADFTNCLAAEGAGVKVRLAD